MINVIQYLHSQDLLHLDLKLENFLIKPQEGIKLIDFESCGKIVENGKIMAKGTPGYRAPEINSEIFTNPKAIDIYSLGIILFMMVAGTPPYIETQENGKWKFDRYYEALRSDLKKFWAAHERHRESEGKESFSQEFETIIESMLCLNSEKRPKIEELNRTNWVQGDIFTSQEMEAELKEYFLAE